jgi:putative oxidoreductase
MGIAKLATIGGRVLLAALFILAGIAKIIDGAPFLAHMAEHGVPGLLLPAVIVLEIGAGVALLIGWRLMFSASALSVFCLLTALLFHNNLGDHAERSAFLKDLALAGALAVIAAGASERVVRSA